MAKLFIVGFPRDMQEIGLVELFSAHGTVDMVTIVTDKNSGESKGYGFVVISSPEGAQRAIAALNGASIGGRMISVRFAEEKQDNDNSGVPDKWVPVKPFRPAMKTGGQNNDPPPRNKRPRKKR
jgi:RNA recognition motif-containing protein